MYLAQYSRTEHKYSDAETYCLRLLEMPGPVRAVWGWAGGGVGVVVVVGECMGVHDRMCGLHYSRLSNCLAFDAWVSQAREEARAMLRELQSLQSGKME